MSVPAPPGRALAVKICGLTRVEDARAAAEAGADYLGAILSPGFSRSVPAERAAAFRLPEGSMPGAAAAGTAGSDSVGALPGADRGAALPRDGYGTRGPTLVAVLVDPTLEEAVAAARASGAGVLQLHGEEPPSLLRDLREEGGWTLWKALQVRSPDDVERALERYGETADGLLLDGWHRGRGGGVGACFPWEVVEPVRGSFPAALTFIAAGGLDASNVGEAVRRLAPDVVDVSSGVEVETGVKDRAEIRAFVRNARAVGGSAPHTGHHP